MKHPVYIFLYLTVSDSHKVRPRYIWIAAVEQVSVPTDINDTVVGEFPAGLESEDAEWVTLFRREVAQGSVRHVIRLQWELVERRQELGHCAHSLVGHVDTVRQGEGHNSRRQTCPQSRLRDLVASGQFQFEKRL